MCGEDCCVRAGLSWNPIGESVWGLILGDCWRMVNAVVGNATRGIKREGVVLCEVPSLVMVVVVVVMLVVVLVVGGCESVGVVSSTRWRAPDIKDETSCGVT